MGFRFIHAADIHLDSPLLRLDEYPGAPVDEIRAASRKALAALVDLTIEREANFLVIAGDLFDSEWRDCNTGLYFISEMKRLRDAGIRAYIALGNHDAANKMLLSLPWPDHVHFFDKKPQQVAVPGCEATLYSQSFRERHIDEDMTAKWPLGDPGRFNIGVLHTSASGAPGHEKYAPCSLDSLRSRRYQYWALGHVHTRRELSTEPWIVFPGNIQGRSVRECGSRGCYVVDVDDAGRVNLTFAPLDVVRWEILRVPLGPDTAPADLDTLAEAAIDHAAICADGRSLAVRIRFEGNGRAWNRAKADMPGLRQRLRMVSQEAAVPMHVEKLEVVPVAAERVEELEAGPLAELRALVREFSTDESLIAELAHEFEELKTRMQGAIPSGEDAVDPQDRALLLDALAAVEPLLEGGLQ
jgi:DNA repair protein SbcD/Mre11